MFRRLLQKIALMTVPKIDGMDIKEIYRVYDYVFAIWLLKRQELPSSSAEYLAFGRINFHEFHLLLSQVIGSAQTRGHQGPDLQEFFMAFEAKDLRGLKEYSDTTLYCLRNYIEDVAFPVRRNDNITWPYFPIPSHQEEEAIKSYFRRLSRYPVSPAPEPKGFSEGGDRYTKEMLCYTLVGVALASDKIMRGATPLLERIQATTFKVRHGGQVSAHEADEVVTFFTEYYDDFTRVQ